jgi:precorrin-6A/cobalt-precorrin-6A reductase
VTTKQRRVLILGGTTEASEIARELVARGDLDVVTSFAGLTMSPKAAAGRTRVGSFGGADGLARYLRDEQVDLLIDATHPLAPQMRWNAYHAAEETGVPRIRVERPGWEEQDGDRWTWVKDLDEAATAIGGYKRVFLSTGRKDLEPFARLEDTWFLVRSIEPPDPMLLKNAEVVVAKGPFEVDGERTLMQEHQIEVLVTKNSGGDVTGAKLVAARELGLPVVIVERPTNPPGELALSAPAAIGWVAASR